MICCRETLVSMRNVEFGRGNPKTSIRRVQSRRISSPIPACRTTARKDRGRDISAAAKAMTLRRSRRTRSWLLWRSRPCLAKISSLEWSSRRPCPRHPRRPITGSSLDTTCGRPGLARHSGAVTRRRRLADPTNYQAGSTVPAVTRVWGSALPGLASLSYLLLTA